MSALIAAARSPFETSEFMQLIEEKDAECAAEAVKKMAEISADSLSDPRWRGILRFRHPDFPEPLYPAHLATRIYREHRRQVVERAKEAFAKKRLNVLSVYTNEDAAAVIQSHEGNVVGMLPKEALSLVQETGENIKKMIQQRCEMISKQRRHKRRREQMGEEVSRKQEWLERALQGVSELIDEAINEGSSDVVIELSEHEWAGNEFAEERILLNKTLKDAGWEVIGHWNIFDESELIRLTIKLDN